MTWTTRTSATSTRLSFPCFPPTETLSPSTRISSRWAQIQSAMLSLLLIKPMIEPLPLDSMAANSTSIFHAFKPFILQILCCGPSLNWKARKSANSKRSPIIWLKAKLPLPVSTLRSHSNLSSRFKNPRNLKNPSKSRSRSRSRSRWNRNNKRSRRKGVNFSR